MLSEVEASLSNDLINIHPGSNKTDNRNLQQHDQLNHMFLPTLMHNVLKENSLFISHKISNLQEAKPALQFFLACPEKLCI